MFTAEQIKELSGNKNVVRCGERSITYDNGFKRIAVGQYNDQGLSSTEIFINAGFDIGVVGKHTPKECLRRWNGTYRTRGVEGLKESRGRVGGRSKTKELPDADKVKRLEMEVAYLTAENDFLVRLRAKRAE